MSAFRTLDHVDVKGKRVLVRVDLNVPVDNGVVSDATRIERMAPRHHRDRRQGRQGHPAVAFRPPEGARPEEFAEAGRRRGRPYHQAAGQIRRRLHRRNRRTRGGSDEERRHRVPGEHPLLSRRGEERSGFRRRAGQARRHFRQRRVLGFAPRARLDRRAGACFAGLCRAHLAGRAGSIRESARQAAASARGHCRRRQDFHQARSARPPVAESRRADHRRRHGQYILARARQTSRQVAGRSRSRADCAEDHGRSQSGQTRDRAAGRRGGGGKIRSACAVARRRYRQSRRATT